MGRRNFEELKETYPKLWQKACKEFQQEKARRKFFLALVEIKKAKLAEQVEREKERKRRTRALILWATSLVRKLETQELKELIELVRDEMRAREGKTELDYLPFLISEIKQYHPDFEFTEPEPEEPETEKEPETEEAVAGKEELKKKLENKFQEVAQEAAQKAFQS